MRAKAEAIVESVSAISRLLLGSTEPVSVLRVAAVQADGTQAVFIRPQSAALSLSGGLAHAVTHGESTILEHKSSESIRNWLGKALPHPVAARVLRLRGTGDLSWADLYRLYEVIQDNVGGERAIIEAGWSSRALLSRFTHSADSVKAAGDQARHGVERTHPPSKPLTISEARILLDRLLRAWLDQLP